MGFDDRDWAKQAGQGHPEHPPGFVPPRRFPSGVFSMVLLWLVIGGGLYMLVQGFVPGFRPVRVSADQANEALLSPDRSGNYSMPGAINGVPVTFMVDTGASTVAISAAMADRMGLEGCMGVASQTANGRAVGCMALAREVRFGPFTAHDVRVAVLPNMPPDTALLGMNVLSRLQIIQQGGRLVLRLEAH